jgi:hypothetical protein
MTSFLSSRAAVVVALLLPCLWSCAGAPPGPGADPATTAEEPAADQRAFFQALGRWCGRSFEGATEFPPDPDHPMAGKRLLLTVSPCSEGEIRVPFQVGEDRSRTWILTLGGQGLLLKHDHRHADGTPDAVTNYGGWATAEGDATRQRFAADPETARLIPEAATNVWTLELDPATGRLVYALERHGQPRYRATFRLLPAAPPGTRPPAP